MLKNEVIGTEIHLIHPKNPFCDLTGWHLSCGWSRTHVLGGCWWAIGYWSLIGYRFMLKNQVIHLKFHFIHPKNPLIDTIDLCSSGGWSSTPCLERYWWIIDYWLGIGEWLVSKIEVIGTKNPKKPSSLIPLVGVRQVVEVVHASWGVIDQLLVIDHWSGIDLCWKIRLLPLKPNLSTPKIHWWTPTTRAHQVAEVVHMAWGVIDQLLVIDELLVTDWCKKWILQSPKNRL